MNDVRVFISSVSAEFGSYRDELRHLLERPNVSVKIQEDFIAAGTVTLDKLDTYIASCEAVVHLVGDRTGSPANASSLAWLRQRYPQLAEGLPALDEVLDGTVAASYTQWEAYLALYHGKVLLVATPTAEAAHDGVPGPAAAPSCQSQAVHLERLRLLGSYPEIHFGTADRLVAEVALSTLLDLLVTAGVQAGGLLAALQPRNLPYESLGSLFKGRGPFLRRLRANFTEAGKTRQALYGLGGIGKTRLAVEYAWQHQADHNALLFVTADSAALQTNLANLCSPLLLNLPEASVQEQDVKLGAALRWLQQHPGWLLILDNVDTPEAAKAAEKLLAQLSGGHVLLTTRLSEWSKQMQCLEVEVLPEEDAKEFLLERAARRQLTPTDAADAQALARDVGQLALALEQAGAYIEAKRITMQTYRERWATNYKAVREWSDERLMGYAGSVAVTWQTSFDQLQPAARTLLHRLSWLAAEPVPLALLELPVPEAELVEEKNGTATGAHYSLITYATYLFMRFMNWLAATPLPMIVFNAGGSGQADSGQGREPGTPATIEVTVSGAKLVETEDARTDLARYSLVTYTADNSAISVHRLVQEATRARLDTEARLQTFREALLWVNEAFSGNPEDVRTWPVLDLLQPHALALVNHSQEFSNPSPTAHLLNQLGILLLAKARLAEAEPLLRRALVIREHSLGPNHAEVAISLNNLAQLLADTNRLAEAEPLYRRALAIDEHNYSPNLPRLATRLNNLAQVLADTKRLAEAEPLLRRALAIREYSLGPDHAKMAISLNNLALLLLSTNRSAEAEPLMRRALAIDERNFGPDHPEVAARSTSLALLLLNTNRLAEAEPLFRRALAIDEHSYGPDHPTVATNLANLAQMLAKTNRLNEAVPLMHRVLNILTAFQKQTGYPHPSFQRIIGEHSIYRILFLSDKLSEMVAASDKAK